MRSERVGAVMQAIAQADAEDGASPLDRLCGAAESLLCLRGAGVSLMVDGQLAGTAGVSDPGIAKVQDLQMMLGEGPCLDAWASHSMVLEPNLVNPSVARWPAFSRAGVDSGVLAVFAFPLHLGVMRIGVLVMYRDRARALSADELALAVVIAELATYMVLSLQAGAPADTLHELLIDEPPHWSEIHQATGIVSVQLDVSLSDAFVRMRAHAFASGTPLRLVASKIVAGRLHLPAI